VEDVNSVFPGLLDMTRQWFRSYKIPDGKSENAFAFDGQYKSRDFAMKIIREAGQSWKDLLSGKIANKAQDYCISTETATTYDAAPVALTFSKELVAMKDIPKADEDAVKSYYGLFPFYN
jgi:inorganic pyrophosphatase